MKKLLLASLIVTALGVGALMAADPITDQASEAAAKAAIVKDKVDAPQKTAAPADTKVPEAIKPEEAIKKEPESLKVTKDTGGVESNSLISSAPLRSDFVQGKSSAPIVMVEYASLSCPHCAHFSNTVMPEIEKNYIETGKLRYVLRQFPINEPALKGAMLLDCVGKEDENKYYVFAKVLFDAQAKWAFDGNWRSGLQTIAAVGGVSKEQFTKCTENTDREVRILKAKKEATEELKIPHTPYIYIDGEVYSGDHTAAAVSAFIDAKLAKRK